MKQKIIIATIKSWNIEQAETFKEKNENLYDVCILTNKDLLTYDFVVSFNPKFIFFPHWSWIIPQEIFSRYECIVFHPTDLPYGRGGTPIQNLIINKIYTTKISAIRVNEVIDGGDIYLKCNLDITQGNVKDILKNMSDIVFQEMIPKIVNGDCVLEPQRGIVTAFKRRKPEQSNLLNTVFETPEDIYDFIRMLDGEGYPEAFLDLGKLKIYFSNATKSTNEIQGVFRIKENT